MRRRTEYENPRRIQFRAALLSIHATVCTQLWTAFIIFHVSIRIKFNCISEGSLCLIYFAMLQLRRLHVCVWHWADSWCPASEEILCCHDEGLACLCCWTAQVHCGLRSRAFSWYSNSQIALLKFSGINVNSRRIQMRLCKFHKTKRMQCRLNCGLKVLTAALISVRAIIVPVKTYVACVWAIEDSA